MQEEEALSGHKSIQDRLTLVLCECKPHLKIKPPRAVKEQNVNKVRLPVTWGANAKAGVHGMAAQGAHVHC